MSVFKYSYSPFNDQYGNKKNIFQLTYEDLNKVKNIDESIFIDYKQELSNSVFNKIPKFVTSFANESGGWLFIGINDSKQITPIPENDYENIINSKLTEETSPVPYIVTRFLKREASDHEGILVIWIPEGKRPPYIANGGIYTRIGSGSQPQSTHHDGYYLIKDRYYLDQLYRKSEDYKKYLKTFCRKEIAIKNPFITESFIHTRDLGICNIYIIPLLDLQLYKFERNDEDEKLISSILEQSRVLRKYEFEGISIDLKMEITTHSYTNNSIVFRSSDLLDQCDYDIGWELFNDGNSKFHIPIPYFPLSDEILAILKSSVRNYKDPEIFKKLDYIAGKNFIYQIFACLGLYVNSMKHLVPTFDQAIIAIELLNVQKSVLVFESPTFMEIISTKGLKFSEREKYFINEEMFSYKIEPTSLMWFLGHLLQISNAFGLSKRDGLNCILNPKLINE